MGNEPNEPVIVLSDEMLEAMRILRSDGHTRALEELKESHVAIIARLDKQDAERAASVTTPEPVKTEPSPTPIPGSESGNIPNPGADPTIPQPPPKIDPPVEPIKKGRKAWWESENYKHD